MRAVFRKLLILKSLFFIAFSYAHENGHGPEVAGKGPQGGMLAAVINPEEAIKGDKAKILYKAELKKNGKEVELFLYDTNDKPVDLKNFDPESKTIALWKEKDTKPLITKISRTEKSYKGTVDVDFDKAKILEFILKTKGQTMVVAFKL